MKMNSLSISNLGPYIGDNNFNFDTNDTDKNIILIGGKNGAGKSTLFTSIKVCLYGCRAFGYQSNNVNYYNEIKKIINNDVKLQAEASSGVSLEIQFDDTFERKFLITRNWLLTKKSLQEKFSVYCNNKELTKDELNNFESFLFNALPPDIFKFFFFDGEKIGDFFLDTKSNTGFKSAFLKLFRFDNFSILIKNFERITSGANGFTVNIEKYNIASELLEQQEKIVSAIQAEMEQLSVELQKTEEQLSLLFKNYEAIGGIHIDEWKQLNTKIVQQENAREEIYKWLRDTANTVIPFIIMRNKLKQLEKQIKNEEEIKRQKILLTEFDQDIVYNSVKQVFSKIVDGSVNKHVGNVMSGIKNALGLDEVFANQELILDLSGNGSIELQSQISNILGYDINRIKQAYIDTKNSLKQTKQFNEQISLFNIQAFEEFNRNYELLVKRCHTLREQITLQTTKFNEEAVVLKTKNDEYQRTKKIYENELKQRSVNDLSSKMLLFIMSLQEALFGKKIVEVENNFSGIFKSIISRAGFIDGIHIDNNFNIIPYRNKLFELKEAKNIIKKLGMQYLENNLGSAKMKIIKATINRTDVKKVEIPIPVNNIFSQGEKQILIMSLYYALIQSSNMNIPFIIDTPFARIDKEHRTKIIEMFFMGIKSQIFILSTNEEIVGDYYNIIKPKLVDKFLLQYEQEGRSKVIKGTYFGGER